MRDNVTLDFGEVLTVYFLFGLLLNIKLITVIALFSFTIHQSPFNIHILDLWSTRAQNQRDRSQVEG